MSESTIALCMIVKNEEKNIENCLKSVQGLVNEIIIVDTGSTDKTVEICRCYTDKIFFTEWKNDFSGPRNLSISKAASDWIFLLDADEVISLRDHEKIKTLTASKVAYAYQLTTRNYTDLFGMVNWQKNDFSYPEGNNYKGWVGSTKIRLFRNHMGLFFEGEVHEMIEPRLRKMGLPIDSTDVPIHHYGRSLTQDRNIEKKQLYLEIGLEKVKKNSKDVQANFEIGLEYREIKNFDEAEKYFRKAIEIEPRFYLAYNELAIIAGLKGKILEAITLFNKGISLYPGCADLYNNLAVTYELINNLLFAEKCYKKALDVSGSCIVAQKNLENIREKIKIGKSSVSVCMIVKNEEKNLEELLSFIHPFFEEIIIVDTGSKDNSVKIAQKYGAKVYKYKWNNDFAGARNESIKNAASDWIIWLDADDRLDENNLKKIRRVVHAPKDRAFFCVLSNTKKGEAETTCQQLRIFPNLSGVKFERPIHEQVIFSLKKLNLNLFYTDIVVQHTGYEDEAAFKKKLKRNMEIIENELIKNPEDYHLKFQLASTCTALMDLSRAEKYLKEIIKLDCGFVGKDIYLFSLISLGRMVKADSRFDEASGYYKKAVEIDPAYGIAYFCMGELNLERESYEEAAGNLEQAKFYTIKMSNVPLKKDRLDFLLYYYLGKVYQKLNNNDKTKENLDIAFELGQKKPEYLYDIGLMYIKEKHFNKAEEIFLSLKKNNYNLKDTFFQLAVIKFYQGNIKEAQKMLEDIIKDNPLMPEAYQNLGVIEENSGNPNKAIQYYEQAYKLNPMNFETIANLGHSYLETGKYDLAYEYFQKAIGLNPGEIDIYLGLALIAASEKAYDKLPDLFDKIISIDKNINKLQILNFKSEFLDDKIEYLGDIYQHMHNSRKSLLCYHIVSTLRNDEKFYKEKLIDFYISKDRVNSAIQEIEKVLPYYPDDNRLLLRLGKCYSYLKIPQAARLCYEQILKSNPSDNEALSMINAL